MFWQIMDSLSYPLAGRVKKQIEEKLQEQTLKAAQ
jgi:hypothetical protein